jgi:hypothetical protein
MNTYTLKNGLIATNDGFANYILKAGNGFMRAYSETFDKTHYHYDLCTKRFTELSEECQSWLKSLEAKYTAPYSFAGDEEGKNIRKFYYELTGTMIYVYSSFNSGIKIDNVRRYLVDEGVIVAESYFEKYDYLANRNN